MKLNALEEIKKIPPTLISHVILSCLKKSALHQIIEDDEYKKNGTINIDLTINGNSADLKILVDMWQAEVENFIESEAKKIVKKKYDSLITDKFENISELLSDLESRVTDEIGIRKEDWED